MRNEKRFVSFGKGGYKGFQRVLLDTLEFSSYEEACNAANVLRDFGYWTTLHERVE